MPDLTSLTAEVNAEDRRQYPRKRMLPSLSLVDLGDDNGGLILDLSEGGLAVQAVGPLAPNTIVPLSFHLPDVPTRIDAKAEVSWVTESKMAGIRFLDTPAATQEYIRQWLASNTDSVPGPAEFEVHAAASPLFGQTQVLGSWEAPLPLVQEPAPTVAEAVIENSAAIETEGIPSWIDELPTLAPIADDEVVIPAIHTSALGMESETAPALPAIAALAQSLTRADGIAIVLKGSGGFVCRASKGSAPSAGERIETTSALYTELLRTGLPATTGDAERDQKLDPVMRRRFDIRSLLAVPLFRRGLLVGIFQISSRRPLAFDGSHVATLQRIGDLVITAAEAELDESAVVMPNVMAGVEARLSAQASAVSKVTAPAMSPTAKRHVLYENELQERRLALWLWEIGAAPAGSYQVRRPSLQNRTAQPIPFPNAPAPPAALRQPAFMSVTDDGLRTVRLFNPNPPAEPEEKSKSAAAKTETPLERVRIFPKDFSKLN